jgi:hypothetical protein
MLSTWAGCCRRQSKLTCPAVCQTALFSYSLYLQLDETPLDAAADGDEETLDAVAAAVRDIERIRSYVADLAGLASEVLEHVGPKDDDDEYGELPCGDGT